MKICFRCKCKLEKSNLINYKYYCSNCDEDMFEFEVEDVKNEIYGE